jgi:8-oxo-dGTP pyrophosphatase MutT (NUDIX family)
MFPAPESAVPGTTPDPLQRLVDALAAREPRLLDALEPWERASVGVVVRPGHDLLFIRRAAREGDPWSGHMAFPGGRMDPGDPHTRAVAARESWEEVGLDPEDGHYLGQLDDIESPTRPGRRRLVISAHVWALDHDPALDLNHEVQRVHWVGLPRLLTREGRGQMPWEWGGQRIRLPVVHLDGADIWGLTLRIVDGMLERLGAR